MKGSKLLLRYFRNIFVGNTTEKEEKKDSILDGENINRVGDSVGISALDEYNFMNNDEEYLKKSSNNFDDLDDETDTKLFIENSER